MEILFMLIMLRHGADSKAKLSLHEVTNKQPKPNVNIKKTCSLSFKWLNRPPWLELGIFKEEEVLQLGRGGRFMLVEYLRVKENVEDMA